MRVLLIEDYPLLRNSVEECLIEEGFAVDSSECGEEGLWYALNHDYDVLLLDIMLPKISGLEILKKIRNRQINTPAILISARDSINQRVEGLECGADDYLIKPFALEELIARVKVQIRRKHGLKSPVLSIGDLEIDTSSKTVKRAGQVISLTRKEYNLLECFVFKKGEVLSREYLAQHAYQDYEGGNSNVLDVYVGYLRKKLNINGLPNLIETKRGHGYFLVENPPS
ncbi:response regulator transcription factor [Akkermansiaceae bacterium]|nr:response regulator transcription factor [Akkermansiaceae bacterium]MDB4537312.1 response regulator transcription factor [Akkermansiaceae bacterium]